ncbi:hypothetical protein SDC9_195325 [bioreactor metagenome]|uniref:Uncharacterized protein n=1 Tax=bioreactor metagenome TaxID=1076179 RepID=A0A645I8R9_9ZZZZ
MIAHLNQHCREFRFCHFAERSRRLGADKIWLRVYGAQIFCEYLRSPLTLGAAGIVKNYYPARRPVLAFARRIGVQGKMNIVVALIGLTYR